MTVKLIIGFSKRGIVIFCFLLFVIQIHAEKKPSLILVFSDQQVCNMADGYKNSQIITPNIDKLAGEGLRFEKCFSNIPVWQPLKGC